MALFNIKLEQQQKHSLNYSYAHLNKRKVS